MSDSDLRMFEQIKADVWEYGGRYDGTKPIPVTVTPQYFSVKAYEKLASDSALVLQALETLNHLYCEHVEVQSRFPELSLLRKYIARTPVSRRNINLARFDYVKAKDGSLRMIEPNTDCPGGMTNASAVHRAFRNSVFYDKKLKEIDQPSERPEEFLNLMKSLTKENDPRIGFIWSEVCPIKNDIQNLYNQANKLEWKEPFIGPVQLLTTDLNGHLLADGAGLDVAFTKIDTTLTAEGKIHWCAWSERIEEAAPILNALADGTLLTVSGLPAMMIAENKRSLALLFDSGIRQHFTSEQVDAIDRLVAKTSCIDGLASEQLWSADYVLNNPTKFVLKTPIDTRGRGIHIGKNCTPDEWQTLVNQAQAGLMVVQEYIEPEVELLALDTGSSADMSSVMALFMYAGVPTGVLGRSSLKEVVNVGNGGVFRPTLIVELDGESEDIAPIFS
jgi:hypothetical protein